MPQNETLITTRQAATILGKSPRTVQRMAEAGLIPVVHKLPGTHGAYLLREADVLAVIAEQAA